MLRRLPFALLILVLAAPLAATSNEVLGPDNRVMAARTGWSSELPELDGLPESPILLLEVAQPDGTQSLLLVPGTEDADPETSPFLLFEAETRRLYILWESSYRNLHSRLNLVWWDGETWSEAVELSGHPFSLKLEPRITVTRDQAVRTLPEGGEESVSRTVAHVVWWEPEPEEIALYSPVIFVDGEYIGWNPVLPLHDLASVDVDYEVGDAPRSISPVIRAGATPSAVIIGFAETAGSPLISLGIDIVPDFLMSIGTQARSHILDVGAHFIPGDRAGLATQARSHILDVGISTLSAPAMRFIASEAEASILATRDSESADDLYFIGTQARSHILDVGITVFGSGGADLQPDQRLEIALGDEQLLDLALNVRKIAEKSAPPVGLSETWLLVSANGLSLVAAWQTDADHLSFIASGEDGETWGEPESLFLGGGLDRDHALTLLLNRLDAGN